jgi:hypothetical protein
MLDKIGSFIAGSGQGLQGFTGALGDIFGSSGTQRASGTTTNKGTTTQRVNISDEAIEKIIADVLGGADGLAEIFSGEQTTGIYNSSVAAQAAGDLASKLVGEIAKLRAESEVEVDATSSTNSKTKTKDGGILGGIKNLFS